MASDETPPASPLQRRDPMSPAVLAKPSPSTPAGKKVTRKPLGTNTKGERDFGSDINCDIDTDPASAPGSARVTQERPKESVFEDGPRAPTLVVRYQDFADFYAAHAEPIYRALTVTLGDPVLAADATSEAMTRACQRWSSVRDGSNPPGWVYRVGLNWSRSRWRKLRRERPLDARQVQAHEDLDPTAVTVQAAVAKLPMAQRSIVVLRYYLQWTPTEIAESLDVPVGTVKSRLHRALATMRADLTDPSDGRGLGKTEDLANPGGSSVVAEQRPIDLTDGATDVDLRSRQRSIGGSAKAGSNPDTSKASRTVRARQRKDRR